MPKQIMITKKGSKISTDRPTRSHPEVGLDRRTPSGKGMRN